jgi:hypothetical protein
VAQWNLHYRYTHLKNESFILSGWQRSGRALRPKLEASNKNHLLPRPEGMHDGNFIFIFRLIRNWQNYETNSEKILITLELKTVHSRHRNLTTMMINTHSPSHRKRKCAFV